MVGKLYMLKWSEWKGEDIAWNAILMQFPDYNVYQSHPWGEHRGRFGWAPYRITASKDNCTVAAAQLLVRRFPLNVALVWVPGGPVGLIDTWGDSFRTAIRQVTGARHIYCRINPMRPQSDHDIDQLNTEGWHKPFAPIISGMSLSYNPSASVNDRENKASRNWRHNLRRSLKYGHEISIWTSPDPDEILTVYEAMQSHKKLNEQISRPVLVSMLDLLRKQCIVVSCRDGQGRLLALRGALLLGNKAWDVFAAATPEARKVYASHAAFWELMHQCAIRGVQWYDMSGVDPVNNKGVYDFKKATGAIDLLYLGEWDWATSSVLRRVANFMIKRRSQGM